MKKFSRLILSSLALLAGFVACSPVGFYMAPDELKQLENASDEGEVSDLREMLLSKSEGS